MRRWLTNILAFLCPLVFCGCQGRTYPPGSPLDPNYRPPPSNASQAAALSGGKITRFIPTTAKNPADPSDRVMLKACRLLSTASNTAQSGYVRFDFWNTNVSRKAVTGADALIVGDQVLVQPAAVSKFMGLADAFDLGGHFTIYPNINGHPQQRILLTPGRSFARVGGQKVALQQPVVWVEPEKEQVMLLSDLLTLFRVSDAQTGSRTILQTKIVYRLPPGGGI